MSTYRSEIVDGIDKVPAAAWDALGGGALLTSHAFLSALERTGCVGEDTGWVPRHMLLHRGDELVGAVPLYLKGHSYGEYVFDWAWADAYQRHGLEYYPKWLSAIPFSPISGPRLLTREAEIRAVLAEALLMIAERSGASSLHVLFPTPEETEALREAGCKIRHAVQFHWRNSGWKDFEAFLKSLSQKKRKNIRAERRKVAGAGITTRVITGDQITDADWQFFYRCYSNTYHVRRSTPYLNLAFFRELGTHLARHCVMTIASRGDDRVAASLLFRDQVGGEDRLYGRYWGALDDVDSLHFEVAYYAPMEWAIANGIAMIEGGAQGEHKLARGFMPERTDSAHWLAHPAFAEAVEDFLNREGEGVEHLLDELNEHSPFKRKQTSKG
jgi:predicted N-acyltransferase